MIKFDSRKFGFKFDGFKFYAPRPAPLNSKICHQALDFQILFLEAKGALLRLRLVTASRTTYGLLAADSAETQKPTIPTTRKMLLHFGVG